MAQVNRKIICIDLKSFYASCECIERNLDPFTTPLVVADPSRGKGAITLAITPYLKAKGVNSRGRIFEIPKNIKYIIAKPRMSLYIKKSSEVINVYLDYVAKEDMHIYSIDEVFLDVTNYLSLYKKSDYELAESIIKDIYTRTGLTVTAGIGPNMLIAKLAMDIEAKKVINNIAKWTHEDLPNKLWPITQLTKVWGIGFGMEKKLRDLGIKSIGELANFDKSILKKKFGIIGEELSNIANGIDSSVISDFKGLPKDKSISHSQILFKDCYNSNINIIISEMIDTLLIRLRSEKKLSQLIGFGIGYSRNVTGGFYHSMKLSSATNNHKEFYNMCLYMFDKYYIKDTPIRSVSISLGKLTTDEYFQLNLFENFLESKERENIDSTIDTINEKFGKNSILKATSLLSSSTIKERNKMIGGHNA